MHTSGGVLPRICRVLMLVLMSAGSAQAQTRSLRLEVLDEGTGRPLPGALLSVLADDDSTLAQGLTDISGRAVLQIPKETRGVRVDLLGYASSVAPVVVDDAAGPLALVVALAPAPFELPGVVAHADRRCSVQDGDARVAALWEDARKALEVARWAIAESRYAYEIEHYSRRFDPDGRTVRDVTREDAGRVREPFSSRSPEELASQGYLRGEGDWITAIAPDAEVLLSDSFLDGHCFYVLDDATGFGLAFDPVDRPSTADIAGTILLDRGSGALRAVEFRYVGALAEDRVPEARGRVSFDRLPSGAWVVREWWVRTPILETVRTGFGFESVDSREIRGFYEVGGEILAVRGGEGETILARDRGRIGGTVSMAGGGGPPADVRIALRGTAWVTDPDATGDFVFEDLPGGDYWLDLFVGREVAPISRAVTVRPGDVARVVIEIPSAPEEPEVVPIAGLEVNVEGRSALLVESGFYERQKGGQGHHMDRQDIEDRQATLSDDLLEGVPGVRVIRVGHRRGLNLEGNRVTTFGRAGGEICSPSVWIDGVQVVMGGRDEVVELDVLIRPDLIEGIEVYTSSARIPVRFNVNAMCGVIVVWSRGFG